LSIFCCRNYRVSKDKRAASDPSFAGLPKAALQNRRPEGWDFLNERDGASSSALGWQSKNAFFYAAGLRYNRPVLLELILENDYDRVSEI
jgi:hypothetical protein